MKRHRCAFPSLTASFAACRASDRGASAVEFALVAPLFLVLLLGVLVYGLYFGVLHAINQVAAEAARASVAGVTVEERVALAHGQAAQQVAGNGLLRGASMVVQAGPRAGQPGIFDVQITYDASYLPIFSLHGLLPMPSARIVRTASIQRGGY